jgi:NTE family protein
LLLVLVSGCASYGAVKNEPLEAAPAAKPYSLKSWSSYRDATRANDVQMTLAFSGGGTRAAALSYGVLKALREIEPSIKGRSVRLLDEVDNITSVSGGSFTAAYYGLHGEGIFTDYETVFLKRDVEGGLKNTLFNPINWFRTTGRTERAIEYYDENIFHGATFADMIQENHPLIVINASDLGYGARFSFLQEYFNLLCSDMSSFPVSRAVAASSAVPIVFHPVVVEIYPGCEPTQPWMAEMRERAKGDERLTSLLDELSSYSAKEKRKYAHFVDGGITDNLGLLAVFDIIEAAGGPKGFFKKLGRKPPRYYALISVNASTDPEPVIDATNKQPSVFETVTAMSDIQLHRYNTATIELMKQTLAEWAKDLSTPDAPMDVYFIQLSFRDLAPKRQKYFNRISTSFSLTNEQVDSLIATGGELLRNNAEFRRLVADISK